jgi:hypothetical protein
MEQSLWNANSRSAIQEIPPPLFETGTFITVIKNPPLIPIPSRMNPIHILKPISLWSVLMLSFHPSFPSPQLYRLNMLIPDLHCACYMPRSSHFPSHDGPSNIWCSFIHPITSSLLDSNIRLNILFLNTFIGLCIPGWDLVSHPYKTIYIYIYIYIKPIF